MDIQYLKELDWKTFDNVYMEAAIWLRKMCIEREIEYLINLQNKTSYQEIRLQDLLWSKQLSAYIYKQIEEQTATVNS